MAGAVPIMCGMAALLPTVRRALASAGGGALVIGAGASTGVLAVHLQAQWSAMSSVDATSVPVEPGPQSRSAPPAVVVTVIEERHVTPEPVIVHRKVYTTRTVPAPRASVPQPPKSNGRAASTPSRTVIAPPRPAPRPAPAPAPRHRTSTTS